MDLRILIRTRYVRRKITVTTYFAFVCIDPVNQFPTLGALMEEKRTAFFAVITRIQDLSKDLLAYWASSKINGVHNSIFILCGSDFKYSIYRSYS